MTSGGTRFGRVRQQLSGRPDRTPDQFTATVRTPPFKVLLSAGGAKRALERTDARIVGCRRQINITAFTVRAQFQHGIFLRDFGFQRDKTRAPCPGFSSCQRHVQGCCSSGRR